MHGTSNANAFPPDIISNRFGDVTEVGTMKRKLAGLLMCALPLLGCNNDVQKPDIGKRTTIETGSGPVTITNVVRNVDRKELSAHVEGATFNATLRIIPPGGGGNSTLGGTAMLIDASGKLLYSLEMTVNEETNEAIFRQATDTDHLTTSIRHVDDRIRETYDADGDRASFDYPLLPEETQIRVVNQLQHGLPTGHLPEDVREYAAQAEAFQTYYLPHANNSLNNNEAAALLIQLLSAPEAPYLLLGHEPDPEMNKFIQTFCSFATGCATFVCRFFPTSGICLMCAGAAFACVIFQAISAWTGWGIP